MSQRLVSTLRRSLLGTVACIALIGAALPAGAQEGSDAVRLGQAAARSFNIPPQPLDSALILFGQQSGRQIAADGNILRGVSTQGVHGTMTVDEALRQLLGGTNLTYGGSGGATITLQRLPQTGDPTSVQLDPVRVQANQPPSQAEIGNLPPPYAGGQVARGQRTGLLGNRDYMDTPFSATTYTEQLIQNDQARTLIDIVANDPSVRPTYAQASYDDRIAIRGFLVGTNAMSFNGLFGAIPQLQMGLAGVERVEIFKGPTAFLNGMSPASAVGGTVNFVSKRAGDEPLTRLTANYISDTQFGGHLDVGRRFGADNEFGIRVNAAFTGGDLPTAFVSDDFLDLSAGFDFRSANTRIDADIGYQKRRIVAPQIGSYLNAGLQVPPPPSANDNFYQPWAYFLTDNLFGLIRIEHDVAPNLTVFGKVGASRNTQDLKLSYNFISNQNGDMLSVTDFFPAYITSLSTELGVRTKVQTGGLRHELSLVGTYILQERGSLYAPLAAGPSNIYNPTSYAPPSMAGIRTSPTRTSQTALTSIGLGDSIFMAQDRIQFIVGGRFQQIQVSNFDSTSGQITNATPGYNQSAFTPAVGFVVKPIPQVSLYGNYIQALEQGAVAPAPALNAGQVFPAFVSNQFELGTKLDLGNFGATLSFFQITRPSGFVDATTNMFTADAKQVNRGIEFNVFGEPFAGFRPIGGITFLDARLSNTPNGANNGNYAPGVPNVQLNLGADWETPFIKNFALNGRVIYTGTAYLDPANTQPVAPWTRVDLGARYTFQRTNDRPVVARANVINVGNTNYWTTNGSFLSQNPPRTIMLSLTADF